MFISSAFLRTFGTVLRDTLQLSAMFRSLKFRLCSLIISRYLVIVLTLLIMYLHQSVHFVNVLRTRKAHKQGICVSQCCIYVVCGWLSTHSQNYSITLTMKGTNTMKIHFAYYNQYKNGIDIAFADNTLLFLSCAEAEKISILHLTLKG